MMTKVALPRIFSDSRSVTRGCCFLRMMFSLGLVLLAALWIVAPNRALGQEESSAGQPSATGPLGQLQGQTVDVEMTNHEILANQVVQEIRYDETGTAIRVLKVQAEGERKPRTIRLNQVAEIYREDQPLDVTYDRKQRSLVHDQEKRQTREKHEAEVRERLATKRARYWPRLEESDHQRFLEDHRKFIEDVKTRMAGLNLQSVETERFIFATDLTPQEVNVYIAYLDEMYRQLCLAFGLPAERNVWCGKCVVVTFRDQANYMKFEAEIMGVDAKGSQGMCHQKSDGTVIFAGYKGNGGFGHVLVHETTHGFVHRYLSSARIPSWLNEGISDWMANAVVKGTRGEQRARQSAELALRSGGIGDLLTTERISAGSYGAACSMVEILVARDKGNQFRKFVVLLKEGNDPETALQEAFGLTYSDMEALYANQLRRLR